MINMYRIIIFVIILFVLSCNYNNKESFGFKIIKNINVGYDYKFKEDDVYLFEELYNYNKVQNEAQHDFVADSCLFIDNNVVVLTEWEGLTYYDISNKKVIRWLKFKIDNKTRINHKYHVVAIKKNKYDLYIIAYGIVYEYNYQEDKLKVIFDKFDDLINKLNVGVFASYTNYTEFTNPIYNSKRNTIVFSGYDLKDDVENLKYSIFEFDLIHFNINILFEGYCPKIVESTNSLYYIDNENRNTVIRLDMNSYGNKKEIFKYNLPIYHIYFNQKGSRMVFIHRDMFRNIKGNYQASSKIVDLEKSKVKSFSSTFTSFPSDLIFPEDMK